jgi:ATP-dependent Lon protease
LIVDGGESGLQLTGQPAAQCAGLSTVFIPARNEPDLDDVPAEVLEALTVTPMTDVAEIVRRHWNLRGRPPW